MKPKPKKRGANKKLTKAQRVRQALERSASSMTQNADGSWSITGYKP